MVNNKRLNTVPPYVPYRTFRTFLEFLQEGIPDRIDRSVWVNRFSGSSGTQLVTALKALGLIDEMNRPSADLEKLVYARGRDRREMIRMIIERFYVPIFALDLKKATKNQFREAFRMFGTKEGVLTKCEAFFIRAAQDAGIELSQYILARRHGSGRTSGAISKPKNPSDKQSYVALEQNNVHNNLSLIERILDKYPEFDPKWDPEVQTKWLDGMTKLYESLTSSPNSPE